MNRAFLLFLAALLLVSSGAARAQPVVPGTAEPSRVREQIAPMTPQPRQEAAAPSSAPAPTAAPEGMDKIVFTLSSVEIQGMTVYKSSGIAPLWSGMKGKKVSLADMYDLAAKLTVKYRNDGYILTQVVLPEQDIADGKVRLLAVEGFVDKVSFKGVKGRRLATLRAYARKITASRPLKNAVMERALLLMNDLPGTTAQSVLSPSASKTGAADMMIIVTRKPYDVFASADNRGSRYIGPYQASAGVTFNNTLGLYEGLGFQWSAAPEGWPRREMGYAGVSWSQPVGGAGTKADVSASVTSTHPGHTLEPFHVRGISRSLSLGLTHPFIRARAKNLSGSVKLDILNSTRNDDFNTKGVDRTRALRAGYAAQFSDPLRGFCTVSGEVSKGLGILDATRKGQPNATRLGGDPKFLKASFDASRTQGITGPYEAFVGVTGQKSANLLLASEEFGVGGASYGSAYDSSELTGEDGAAFRAELRRWAGIEGWNYLQLYAFYDIGVVHNRDDAMPRHRKASLADAGLGFRFALNDHFSGSFEAAEPLTRPVSATGEEDPRFFFSLSARF